MIENTEHKAGFVSIIGKPNVGKSTLMNALIGERLSIITSKAQTTRHRIFGILNGDDFQIVYSDTPGIIAPKYELHRSMMKFVNSSLEDADMVLFVTDLFEEYNEEDESLKKLKKAKVPVILVLNKIDLAKSAADIEAKIEYWKDKLEIQEHICISALHKTNTEELLNSVIEKMPVHPPYFPKDSLTDKPEKFFASEIIREKIFLNYKKEVPYSTEVVITEFKETEKIIRMRAEIYCERRSQRVILIVNKGASIKKVGIEARKDLEEFFQKQVYLETYIKVDPDWRKNDHKLKRFGYNEF